MVGLAKCKLHLIFAQQPGQLVPLNHPLPLPPSPNFPHFPLSPLNLRTPIRHPVARAVSKNSTDGNWVIVGPEEGITSIARASSLPVKLRLPRSGGLQSRGSLHYARGSSSSGFLVPLAASPPSARY